MQAYTLQEDKHTFEVEQDVQSSPGTSRLHCLQVCLGYISHTLHTCGTNCRTLPGVSTSHRYAKNKYVSLHSEVSRCFRW